MDIRIVTDSTSYIPEELVKKYDISVVSLNVVFDNESYREMDIDTSTFYERMKESKSIPTSSQPGINEIYEIFNKCAAQGDAVVGIFLSSDMSGTYSSAHLARSMVLENYPEALIEILDSRSNCMQAGFSVIEAARASKEGETLGETVNAAKAVIDNSKFLFVPDTLEYLKKGGRIGGAAALLGAIFQIRPILTVADGKTAVFDKVRTKKKAIDRIIETFVKESSGKELGDIIVHHINDEKGGKELAARLEEILDRPVESCPLGPVIGLHVGPGTVGIVYYTK